jgi:hypothetical protein
MPGEQRDDQQQQRAGIGKDEAEAAVRIDLRTPAMSYLRRSESGKDEELHPSRPNDTP